MKIIRNKKKKKATNTSETPQDSLQDGVDGFSRENTDVMDLDNLNVQGIKDENISHEDEIKSLEPPAL